MNVYTFDKNPLYSTKKHNLALKQSKRNDISIRLSKGKINIIYPLEIARDAEEVEAAIWVGINRALAKEAREYLPKRVKKLAKEKRFKYSSFHLENDKSRWGSCSIDNEISLSIQLMRIPDHLIDYVILHELAHTVEKNHKEFWKLLDSVCGKSHKLQAELNNYRKYRKKFGIENYDKGWHGGYL